MGVNLTPIVVKHIVSLEDLSGRSLAVDANNVLYQFVALIRTPSSLSLKAPDGTVTSHLAGLLYRTTRLISEYNLRLVFVFDGEPPRQKEAEIQKRRAAREKKAKEWQDALKAGDYAKAFSKATVAGRLTQPMIQDAKKLLCLLGVPIVQAPSEAEAQAAHMANRGDVWGSSSQDYDSLLFGTPLLVRYLTISGREFLPSKGSTRPLKPELIVLEEFLSKMGVTREQLVDMAILMGTDYNRGIKGVGPKTALRLIRENGRIENLPDTFRDSVSSHCEEVRKLFLEPEFTADYDTKPGEVMEDEVYAFLCYEKGFSRNRVEKAIQRIKHSQKITEQSALGKWLASPT